MAVTALLLLPLRGVPVPGGSDLIGHFLLFAAMAFAAVGFARSPAQLAWLAFVTVGLGAMLEFAQGVTPYRSSEFTDGVANSLGGLAGYAIALVVVYFVIRPAERKFGLATRGYDPNALATRDGAALPEWASRDQAPLLSLLHRRCFGRWRGAVGVCGSGAADDVRRAVGHELEEARRNRTSGTLLRKAVGQ